ncbi:hypothetical protein LS215_0566 [Sulfolobus islandicus L.S.2.15]|uniref:DUF3093 domain-containing protein n=2 Tax=Saccharolobus islandicus TaxID=43080 RepID=C3MLR8_SACI2|nr:hypothetical protein LS215_0566 [Sulfolobus islandicus L.S.2.15]
MHLFTFSKILIMKAPLMLRIHTKRGDKLFLYIQIIFWLAYVLVDVGIFLNKILLFGVLAAALGTISIILAVKSYSYLNLRITPERVEVGRLKIPLDRVREIRVLRSNDSTADLSIVYEGGEKAIKEVKNWEEVLETFQIYKESVI